MKRTFLIYSLILFIPVMFYSCNNKKINTSEDEMPAELINNSNSAENSGADKIPMIEFQKTLHDFGTIIEGTKVIYSYKFKNTGGADLLISNVKPACGCTVAEYPKIPIAPGDGGKITITFDSRGKRGPNLKTITVLSNAEPNTVVLKLEAMVK